MAGTRPRIIIIGGGFAGLYAAFELARAPADVLLIDRRNHHLFQPLLYQVATAGLNPADIASPIRRIVRKQKNTTVVLGDVTSIDIAAKEVVLADRRERYDHLILATGATHSYFGHDEWAPVAPGLKTLEDALEIRKRVLLAFEAAEREPDPERRKPWLTFAVVGAGPTGVELAGALAEIARHALVRDFRRIDSREARVILIEGVDRVLPQYPEHLSPRAQAQLARLGVEVRTRARVTAIDAEGVQLGDERLAARTVLWAAGVAASPLGRSLGAATDKAGRVLVKPDLSIENHPEVLVAGDLASLQQDGKPIPGVAPAAIQMGRHAARNVLRTMRGEPAAPFRYRDKGSLATIGRGAAVAQIGRVSLSGFVAWMAWLLIHIFFLIGFRNRVLVLIEWAWAYVTWERGARLITGPTATFAGPERRA